MGSIHLTYVVVMLFQIYDNSKQYSPRLVYKTQMSDLLATEGTKWHVDELPSDHEVIFLEDYFEQELNENEVNSIFLLLKIRGEVCVSEFNV